MVGVTVPPSLAGPHVEAGPCHRPAPMAPQGDLRTEPLRALADSAGYVWAATYSRSAFSSASSHSSRTLKGITGSPPISISLAQRRAAF